MSDAIDYMEREYHLVRKHFPEEAGRFAKAQVFSSIAALGLLVSLGLIVWAYNSSAGVPWAFVVTPVSLIVFVLSIKTYSEIRQRALDAEIYDYQTSKHTIARIDRTGALNSVSIKDLEEKMAKDTNELKQMARQAGRTIIHGNVTVSGHGIANIGSAVSIIKQNPAISDEITQLVGLVDRMGDAKSKEILSELLKAHEAGSSKVVTGALWDQLVKVLPAISSLATAFVTLTRLFT